MKRTRSSSTAILVALILFVVFFVLFMYTFLHEAGHAILGFFFGQSLAEFNIDFWDLSAHVNMFGGELSQAQLTIQSMVGAALPLLLWMVFISIVPRKASFLIEVLKLSSSMVVVNTLLAWIVLPILFLFGKAPSDDVIHFLSYSQMPPLLVASAAFILYIGGWVLFLSKIDGLRNEFLMFRTINHDVLTKGIRTSIPMMASFIAVCVIFVFALNRSALKNSFNKFSPPRDFESVAQIDLSTQTYFAETLTEFSLDQVSSVGVFIVVDNIHTTYLDVRITGPSGFDSIVLHGEGYNAVQDGGLWEQNLAPGTYQIVLTSDQSSGTLTVYMKSRN